MQRWYRKNKFCFGLLQLTAIFTVGCGEIEKARSSRSHASRESGDDQAYSITGAGTLASLSIVDGQLNLVEAES